MAAVFFNSNRRLNMSVLFYVSLGLAINVGIVIVGLSIKKKRPKMQYDDYLEEYGRSEPYTSDDVDTFMGGDDE
jgi:hypothetical protein